MPIDQETGLRYYVRHERAIDPPRPGKFDDRTRVSSKGGRTVVEILDQDGRVLATGEAVVHPNDNYNRKRGRDVALGRARKQLRENGSDRRSLIFPQEFAEMMALAIEGADQEGLCFVHLEGNAPAEYAVMTATRYRELTGRIFEGEEIPMSDPEWRHTHVEPAMLEDPAVRGVTR